MSDFCQIVSASSHIVSNSKLIMSEYKKECVRHNQIVSDSCQIVSLSSQIVSNYNKIVSDPRIIVS